MTVRSRLASSAGFTFIAAMVTVTLMGIMLGMIGQSWRTMMKREKEEELIFRGMQYRNAIERWNKPRPGQHVVTPLNDLKDLLKDPRSLANVRYLRRLYTDPITGKEFEPVKDPGGVKGIIGVVSSSPAESLKKANFPPEFKELEGKNKYKDWQFVYRPQGAGVGLPAAQQSSVPGGTVPMGGTLPTGGTVK